MRRAVGLMLAGAVIQAVGCSPHRTATPVAPAAPASIQEPDIEPDPAPLKTPTTPPAGTSTPKASGGAAIDDAISKLRRAQDVLEHRAYILDRQ